MTFCEIFLYLHVFLSVSQVIYFDRIEILLLVVDGGLSCFHKLSSIRNVKKFS